jgi:hypothetical protein
VTIGIVEKIVRFAQERYSAREVREKRAGTGSGYGE